MFSTALLRSLFLALFQISHRAITANSCFFFSILSFFFSLPSMLASSIFLSEHLTSSPETLVKDNIYRKPPIYKQHGTVQRLFNTQYIVLVQSLHDVLHVARQSPVLPKVLLRSPFFSLRPVIQKPPRTFTTWTGVKIFHQFCNLSRSIIQATVVQ